MVLFRKKHALTLFGLSAVILLSGCTGNGDKKESGEKKTLKVMYESEGAFFRDFGMPYSVLHPDVEIEVVPTEEIKFDPEKNMNAERLMFIEEKNPDVVLLDQNTFKELAPEGKLLELDTIVEDKKFNKEALFPGLLDYIRDLGGGKLFGLATNFSNQVIYYNKDLFKKYNIPLPTDKMSWEKLLELAQRFPTDGAKEDRVYGLNLGSLNLPYQLGSMIGSSLNLNIVNANKQVTMNTPGWQKAFDLAFRALKSDAIYFEDTSVSNFNAFPSYEALLFHDPLTRGKAAMKLDSEFFIFQLKEAQRLFPDKAVKEWGMVTIPVDPQFPDRSPLVSLNTIFAVNAKSKNVEEAKKFIQYATSEEHARVTSKIQTGGPLSVRTNFYDDKDDHNMKAFYALKPIENSNKANTSNLPSDFFTQFSVIAYDELGRAYHGRKSLEEALKEMQTRGQSLLLQFLQAQKDGKNKTPAAATNAESNASAAVEVK